MDGIGQSLVQRPRARSHENHSGYLDAATPLPHQFHLTTAIRCTRHPIAFIRVIVNMSSNKALQGLLGVQLMNLLNVSSRRAPGPQFSGLNGSDLPQFPSHRFCFRMVVTLEHLNGLMTSDRRQLDYVGKLFRELTRSCMA